MIKFNDLLDAENITNNSNTVQDIIIPSRKAIRNKTPWVDKYRPTKLDQIVYQTEVVKMLKKTLQNGSLPHLLFHGPPGTGKTSTILAVALELFGPRIVKDRVLELNASDERGINIVRNKLVTNARTAIGENDPNYPCPPYRIIILDEADAMTTEAQSALRKTMEDNSSITRFCFICNYINKIIDPITSRCVKFRFKSINKEVMVNKLNYITKNENMEIEPGAIDIISEMCNGDMRKAIMLLQNLKYNKKNISLNDVYELSGRIPDNILVQINNICILNKTLNLNQVVEYTKLIQTYGYPIHNTLDQINAMVNDSINITDSMKAIINIHLAKTEKRLIDGADEYLQLLSVLMCIKCVVLNLDTSIYLNIT